MRADQARALFDERSEEFARAPLAGRQTRQRVGRAEQAAVRRTAPHAAPRGIDEMVKLGLPVSVPGLPVAPGYPFFAGSRKRLTAVARATISPPLSRVRVAST